MFLGIGLMAGCPAPDVPEIVKPEKVTSSPKAKATASPKISATASPSPTSPPSGTPTPQGSGTPSPKPIPTPTPTPTPGPPAAQADIDEATAFPFTKVGQKWVYQLGIKASGFTIPGDLTIEVIEVLANGDAKLKLINNVDLSSLGGGTQKPDAPPLEKLVTKAGSNPYAQVIDAINGGPAGLTSTPVTTLEKVTVPAATYEKAVKSTFTSTTEKVSAQFSQFLVKDVGMVKQVHTSPKLPLSFAAQLPPEVVGFINGDIVTTLELKNLAAGATPNPNASPTPQATTTPIPQPTTTPTPKPSLTPTPGPPASQQEIDEAVAFPFTKVGQKWVYKLEIRTSLLPIPGDLTIEVIEVMANGDAKLRLLNNIDTAAFGTAPPNGGNKSIEKVVTRTGGNPYVQINDAVSGNGAGVIGTPVHTIEPVTVPLATYNKGVKSIFTNSVAGNTDDFTQFRVKDLGMVKEVVGAKKLPSNIAALMGQAASFLTGPITTTFELKTFGTVAP